MSYSFTPPSVSVLYSADCHCSRSKNADQDWRANIAAYYTELQTLMSENPIPSHSDDTQQSLPAPFNSKEPRSETLGRTIEYIQDLLEQRKRMSNCKPVTLRHFLMCRLASDFNPITPVYTLHPRSVFSSCLGYPPVHLPSSERARKYNSDTPRTANHDIALNKPKYIHRCSLPLISKDKLSSSSPSQSK